MDDDFLLAIVVLSMLSIFVLLISAFITGTIYFVVLYLFQFKIEILSLSLIYMITILLTGIITYWRISKS